MAPSPSAQPPPKPAIDPKHRFLLLYLAALAVALLCACAFLLRPVSAAPPQLLTAAEFQRAIQPSQLTRLKWKLMRLAGPLWPRAHTFIFMDLKLYEAATNVTAPAEFGFTQSINANGFRLWQIAADSQPALRNLFRATNGFQLQDSCRIQTSDGGQAQVTVGSTTNIAGNLVPLGMTAEVLPKIRGTSFQLIVSAIVTAPNLTSNSPLVQTDFCVSYRASPLDGGAVLLSGPHFPPSDKNYWLVISATKVDDKGNPVRRGTTTVKN